MAGAKLPTWELEEWRYSPIDELDLGRYSPAGQPDEITEAEADALVAKLSHPGPAPDLVVTCNGLPVFHRGATVTVVDEDTGALARVEPNLDLFADMNELYAGPTITVRTRPGQMVSDEIVIVHQIQGAVGAGGEGGPVASFPRLRIDAADGSAVNVIEIYTSAESADALVVPHVEVRCAGAANVGYVMRQHLGSQVWQIGSQISEVDQQATFRSSLAAFGGGYARLRSDCRLRGRGAHGDLDAVYFGDGDQVLDFRTFQDHDAPDTTSNLLFKGVVDDASRAIYTGMIRVAETAPGTNAYQTNSNIKLGPESWAESVPNLEIETDDVRCSHASTVGPIDETQRFYLETRGVPPEVADQLIVAGFFDEVIEDLPVGGAAQAIRAAVGAKLAAADANTAGLTEVST